jgi:hypothetical protein
MEQMRNEYKILVEKPEEMTSSEDLGVEVKYKFGLWIGISWLRLMTVAGFCKHGKECSGFTKCGEFTD